MFYDQYKWLIIVSLFLMIDTIHGDDYSDEKAALRTQINIYKEKIDETRKKIDSENKKAKSDSLSFVVYLNEYDKRLKGVSAEKDSLSVLSESLQKRRDSLAKEESFTALQKDSYTSQLSNLSSILNQYCRQLLDTAGAFGQYNISKQINSLKFLEGEITAGTVTVAEGMERYWQIVSQIEQASYKIETWKGASPVPELHGEVTFIRMGFIWLACAGDDNRTAYIYNGAHKKFEPVKTADQAASIHKAISLQSGMAVPQLIALPVEINLKSIQGDK